MKAIAPILAVALLGCSQPDPKDPSTGTGVSTGLPTGTPGGTSSGTTTTYDPACADAVLTTWPEDGRQTVYYRTAIEYYLNAIAGTEELEVREASGEVPGSMLYFSDHIEFVPNQPLAPNTDYTVALRSCPPSLTSWHTSVAGTPVDPSTLVGTTYAVNVASGRWIEPPGAGSLVAGSLTVDILFTVTAASPTTLTVLGGVSQEGSANQDLCSETALFPDADFSQDPYFEIGPQDISLGILGSSLDITSMHLTGSFRTDLAGIEGATLEGQLDTRGLVDLLAPGGADDAVCVLLGTFGVSCSACVAGGDYCVDAVVEDLAVPSAPGPLVPRTAYDIAMDPSCP